MDRPILFTRTGIMGSAPEGFYEQLVDNYDASIVSKKALDGLDMPVRDKNNLVLSLARQNLEDGINVYNQGYLNNGPNREMMRGLTEQISGALIVQLSIHAPMQIIKERLWQSNFGANGYPIVSHPHATFKRELRVAHEMKQRIDWPTRAEQHLNLNGTKPVDVLLHEVDVYVRRLERAA